ncbi:MAG: hypothetical protein NUV75_12960, partial [Gallionella sp.]|nr:hypothetical protein [Gallionella sp.]
YGPKINGHSQIVAVCPTQNHGEDYDSQQVFANARLIAAEPTMYDYILKKSSEGDSDAARIIAITKAQP